MSVLTGNQEYFKGIGKIPFEGKESKNYLAFKYYNPSTKVMGKTMAEHFKFAISYWHSFRGDGGDPFGSATKIYPWDTGDSALIRARNRADAAFEFFTKLGVDYFCFHDVDMLEEDGADLTTYRKRIDEITDYVQGKMNQSGIKLLWGTANLFSHPRYMNGASTNPDFAVVAHAGAQVKNALDATIKLDLKGSKEHFS